MTHLIEIDQEILDITNIGKFHVMSNGYLYSKT